MEKRREKGVERVEKREGLMVEKLKGGGVIVGNRRGPSTPPPTWRLEFPSQQNGNNKNMAQEFPTFPSSTLSARKLCAKIWEIQSHQLAPLVIMSKPGNRVRRHIHHREVPKQPADPPHSPSYQVAPDNHVNPISSLDFKGRIGESSCNPKTSRELLKVLNRIQFLEEQHVSNIAIVKALKMELGLSQTQFKELLQEKQMKKLELEDLMKQITEEKLVRRNKEHDKIKAVVQSVKEEIAGERRLRKHSESLHQRLVRELSEVKSSFCGTLRDLERERKARILLENLCDEFAKGVRVYEHEVSSIMHNADNGQIKRDNNLDRLILHISEAWLDERMQMKLVQAGSDLPETHSIIDKLGVDIERFLRAKRSADLRRYGNSSTEELKEIHPCLHSLDSFPLKETINVPHNMAEEDSAGADIFEQKRTAEEITEDYKLQAKAGKNISCDENESLFVEGKSSEIGGDITTLLNAPGVISTGCETIQGPPESDRHRAKRMNSSHRLEIENLVGNSNSLSSEGDKVYPEIICREDSCVHSAVIPGNGSPVKQWKTTLIVPDFNKSQFSSKLPRGVKDNKFMTKLLEARLEGHKSRSIALAKVLFDQPDKFVMRQLECE